MRERDCGGCGYPVGDHDAIIAEVYEEFTAAAVPARAMLESLAFHKDCFPWRNENRGVREKTA